MDAPIVLYSIPAQVVNELAVFEPVDFSNFISAPDGSPLTFRVEILGGGELPKGMSCSEGGVLTGTPARKTFGGYDLVVTALNEAGAVSADFHLMINPALTQKGDDFNQLKSEVWQSLAQHLPLPELADTLDRPMTVAEVYYLLERWSVLKIWNTANLEHPNTMIPLTLEGVSQHYNVFDRGSCLVSAPKNLFSHERTLADGLQTAKALGKEAYNRQWKVELVGFHKFTRAAWIEIQRLGAELGKPLDIVNYVPSRQDIDLYKSHVLASNKPEMD